MTHAPPQRIVTWLGITVLALASGGCGSRPPAPGTIAVVAPEALPEGWDPGDPRAGSGIATAAEAAVGAPYRYGGTGPGYDCSGLVHTIYLNHGIALPRTVVELARVGTPVSRLVPGDLVFFRLRGGSPSHVGIYVGDGQFVHASSGQRRVVVESLAVNHYFRERYAGARRILPLQASSAGRGLTGLP